jgi:sec-independent protein translocase protein TatA
MEWIIVIIAIVLLLFGAKKIPEFARGLGKAKAEFQRGQMIVEKEIREAKKVDSEKEAKASAEEKDKIEEKLSGEDLHKAAWEKGINPEGKTDEELRILIKHKAADT